MCAYVDAMESVDSLRAASFAADSIGLFRWGFEPGPAGFTRMPRHISMHVRVGIQNLRAFIARLLASMPNSAPCCVVNSHY